MINMQSLLRSMARLRRQIEMQSIDAIVNGRSPIHYAPHENSGHDKEVSLAVAQVNRALAAPIFCCHGKLARIQCHKCG